LRECDAVKTGEREKTPVLSVEAAHAQSALEQLRAKGWVNESYAIGKRGKNVLIPIREDRVEQVENARIGKMELASLVLNPRRPGTMQEELASLLTPAQLDELGSSFDVIGDIAQLELSDGLKTKQEDIAAAIMRIYPHIKTVVKKSEGTGGPYRIRPVSVIAGEERTNTISKENGISLAIDLNKAYYNPRAASERMRVVEQIKTGENVLVLFAGVGPYAILTEKKAKPAKIIAIELNPDAVEMMKESIELNKCKKIEAICGDVMEVLAEPKVRAWAGRIIMPHPTDSMRFLPSALGAARGGAIIHLYAFGAAEEPLAQVLQEAQTIANKEGYSLSLLSWRVVRTYSPNLVQIVLDLQVNPTS